MSERVNDTTSFDKKLTEIIDKHINKYGVAGANDVVEILEDAIFNIHYEFVRIDLSFSTNLKR